MIRRLRLEAWRAFEHLDLPFAPGTTFVTARNGVGKTSVIQGLEWGLFGDRASIDPTAAIRKGAPSASVEIELVLPGDSVVTIQRTVGPRKNGFTASVDGRATSEADVQLLLSQSFGTGIDDLVRLSVVPAGTIIDYSKEQFHLRRHLCRLFGIDRLEAAGKTIDRARKAVASDLRKVRDVRSATAAELEAMRGDVDAAEAAIATAKAASQVEAKRVGDLREVEREALAFEEYEKRAAAFTAQLTDLSGQLAEVTGDAVTANAFDQVLAGEERRADTRAEELIRRQAELDGRLAAAAAAREQLHGADSDCPVCRRPLGPNDVAAADAVHDTEVARLAAERETVAAALFDIQVVRRQLSELSRERRNVPDPGNPSAAPTGNPDVLAAQLAEVEAAYRTMAEAVGRADANAAAARQRLAEETARAAEQQAAITLYAREAVVAAAAETFEAVTSQLIEEQIDPLAREVARRWKMVFGGKRAALTLDADGRLYLDKGGHEIGFADMSAGERAVAVITTRLLVLSATTKSAFVCFDEPLELLDPMNRRIVALSLAQASGSVVRQVIATTFEDGLARRLASALPNVHVETVTAAEEDDLTPTT